MCKGFVLQERPDFGVMIYTIILILLDHRSLAYGDAPIWLNGSAMMTMIVSRDDATACNGQKKFQI